MPNRKRASFLALVAGAAFSGLCLPNLGAEDSFANSVKYANIKPRYDRFFNNYHESAVYKIDLKWKTEARILTTLDQAMDLVRLMHDLSGGLHQIVYLVGWNYDGHDSKFPAWDKVGDQCRSSYSDDPLTSLRTFMHEARKLNADVSFHINANDAYTNSPLWQTYLDLGLLCRNADGSPVKGGVWGGEQSYLISHAKEWRSGHLKKRILGLLEMIPELRDSRTIHIDALAGVESKYDKIGLDEDVAAIGAMTDFWHEQGIDVTIEFLPAIDQIGYFPMMYHFNVDERIKTLYPPELVCGGAGYNTRNTQNYYNKQWQGMMPMAGCVYEEAWGIAHWGDLTANSLNNPRVFADRLFRTVLLYAYYNRSHVAQHVVTLQHYRVERANGVVADVRMKDRALTVTDNGRTVVENGDYLLDFPQRGGVLLAHSEKGCDRTFRLPPASAAVAKLVGKTYPSGTDCEWPVADGKVRVKLAPQETAVLKGVGN